MLCFQGNFGEVYKGLYTPRSPISMMCFQGNFGEVYKGL